MPALILRPQFPNLWPVQKRPESGANTVLSEWARGVAERLKTSGWSAEGDTQKMDVTVVEGEHKE